MQSRPLQRLWKDHLGRLRRACRIGDGGCSGGTALHLRLTRRSVPALQYVPAGRGGIAGHCEPDPSSGTSGRTLARIAGEPARAVTVARLRPLSRTDAAGCAGCVRPFPRVQPKARWRSVGSAVSILVPPAASTSPVDCAGNARLPGVTIAPSAPLGLLFMALPPRMARMTPAFQAAACWEPRGLRLAVRG